MADGARMSLHMGPGFVVFMGRIARPADRFAVLIESDLFAHIGGFTVQRFHIARQQYAMRVVPRAAPDAITCIDRRRSGTGLVAEIGMPNAIARTHPIS